MTNRYLCVAALLAARTSAMADISPIEGITLYGLADVAFTSTSNVAGSGQQSIGSDRLQPSRLGFRGERDLGEGLHAIMVLESGVQFDTGVSTGVTPASNTFFNRQSYVGLKSDSWGSLTLGRQYSPMYDYFVFLSQGPLTSGMTALALDGLAVNGPSAARFDNRVNGTRTDNAVKYVSPTFNNFKATLGVGFGEVSGSDTSGRTTFAGLGYKNGPWEAAISLVQSNCSSAAGCAAKQGNDNISGIGGAYDFGVAKLAILLTTEQNAKLVQGNDADVSEITLSIPYKKWTFGIGYETLKDKSALQQNHTQKNLGVQYDLGNKVTLYGFCADQQVDNGGIAGMATLNSSNSSQTQVGAGIRVVF